MMQSKDIARLTFGALRSHGLRTLLAALAIAVGIAAVILLTSIGQGVREYVTAEFTQFGTNLIIVQPGRVITGGIAIGVFGTVRPLTIEDAEAVRRAPYVLATNAVADGNAEVTVRGKRRRITIYAMTADWPRIGHMSVRSGSFLPREELYAPRPLAVLGSRAKQELFGNANPLGERITVGGSRYRVIGVMASKGQFLGMDLDDTVYIPVARGLDLFNRDGLTGFHVIYDPRVPADRVVEGVRRIIVARHGRDDITVITQQKMLDVLGSVLGVLTFAVGALGSISLIVGGVGILTIMTIAVKERTSEIGLLVAIGATRQQIVALFLGEAALLAAIGGTAGLVFGAALAQLITVFVPALPVSTPWWFAALAEAIAIVVGLGAGVVPAHRASRMEPVDALRAE